LILDPWNEFDHTRPNGQTETEYICTSLTQIRRFARAHGVHVWLVAHPQKLYRREDGTYPIPTPYDISGSAHWRNKADNCLTVWRDELEPAHPVKLYVQKIRFREVGKIGVADLQWNRLNGRYEETADREIPAHWQERG
jgi:twinkle protein